MLGKQTLVLRVAQSIVFRISPAIQEIAAAAVGAAGMPGCLGYGAMSGEDDDGWTWWALGACQAKEVGGHAQVPILVAINKTDLPSANPDKVKKQLQEVGLTPEEWGGETICC